MQNAPEKVSAKKGLQKTKNEPYRLVLDRFLIGMMHKHFNAIMLFIVTIVTICSKDQIIVVYRVKILSQLRWSYSLLKAKIKRLNTLYHLQPKKDFILLSQLILH
jgi:hypothetical protein